VFEFGVFAKLQAELEIRDESGISPLLLRRRAGDEVMARRKIREKEKGNSTSSSQGQERRK
jgi:hypothetical protein